MSGTSGLFGVMAVVASGVVLAGGSPAHAETCVFEEPMLVRVTSFNVRNGALDQAAVSDIATTIDKDPNDNATGLNPDIACFQELDEAMPDNFGLYRDQWLPGYDVFTARGDRFNYSGVAVRPDITVVQERTLATVGPRDHNVLTLDIPGAADLLTIINVHFDAGFSAGDQSRRRGDANAVGRTVWENLTFGLDTDPTTPGFETPVGFQAVIGDCNSDFSSGSYDGTLDGLLVYERATAQGTVLEDTTLVDFPFESLANAANPGVTSFKTFNGGSRLDYFWPDEALAAMFDLDGNMFLDQDELNAGAFIYDSRDNVPGVHFPGQFANGNDRATVQASDHYTLVIDIPLPRDPATMGVCCVDEICCVATEQSCLDAGGVFFGSAVDCSTSPCTSGACCLPSGECVQTDSASCAASCGVFRGLGELCDGAACGDLCRGDANGDGRTDLDDFSVLAVNFGLSVPAGTSGDLDCSGTVTLDDFSSLAVDFGCGV